jgi:CheY-like chemotaxis protein
MDISKPVILVADDEELIRKIITAVVNCDGYRLLIGSDGAEALELSRQYQGHINLLISDIQMPGMTGIELAEQLARERPGMKVLLISGDPGQEIIPERFHFLPKPFLPEALLDAIGKLMQTEEKVIG